MLLNITSPIAQLLLRWEQLRAQGQEITPEELCRDCPELLGTLVNGLSSLQTTFHSIYSTPGESSGGHSPTQAAPPLLPEVGDYQILRELGHGGMGIVFQAFDRKRREMVALKTLQRIDAAALYRLKQEFRNLAEVTHPNLVGLYELISAGHQCSISMELIEGSHFLAYIRAGASVGEDVVERQLSITPGEPEGVSPRTAVVVRGLTPNGTDFSGAAQAARSQWSESVVESREEPDGSRRSATKVSAIGLTPSGSLASVNGYALSPQQYDRLRESLRQLALGLSALHAHGKVHRDIKPSNVMVTREGRVVILDFGLAAELDVDGVHQSTEQHVAGTIAYMAPEQAASKPQSTASDWYSVGVMLYEALTGQLPFSGSPIQVLINKQQREPLAPAEVASGVPTDLNTLCVALLRKPPEARPSGQEVLQQLGKFQSDSAAPAIQPSLPMQRASFVGRETQLAELHAAFQTMRNGRPSVVRLQGRSGAGKSMLAQHFLDDLLQRGEAVVLSGKCYERESVPYKALDSLIDALSRYLRRLPTHEAQALLPRDAQLLARVFPVLQRVAAVMEAPGRVAEIVDQGSAMVMLAEGVRLFMLDRPEAAAIVFENGHQLARSAGVKNVYVYPHLPWLASALRRQAEKSPRDRWTLLKRAASTAQEALRIVRTFQNDLPHTLRECGRIASMRGRIHQSRQHLDESLAVAERQGARFEHAQTLLARGIIGQQHGWSEAQQDLTTARQALRALGADFALDETANS